VEREKREVGRMPFDPVCRMDLDDQNAVASSDYQGKVYWFCAHTCKEAFDEDPERYLRDISINPPKVRWWGRHRPVAGAL
jgi:YHS domain-containing protein